MLRTQNFAAEKTRGEHKYGEGAQKEHLGVHYGVSWGQWAHGDVTSFTMHLQILVMADNFAGWQTKEISSTKLCHDFATTWKTRTIENDDLVHFCRKSVR